MKTWNDITLFAFQRIEQINADMRMDELEKVFRSTCEVYGLTEYELNEMPFRKVSKMIEQVTKLMLSKPDGIAKDKIGPYTINYDPAEMTLGQFVELRYFLQEPIQMAHYALASIARKKKQDEHPLRADYFLRQPVINMLAALSKFSGRFDEFLKPYKPLFGIDKDMYEDGQQGSAFNQKFGWIYSATEIAAHERVTLEQAFGLPVRQAFNDLAYLKAKGRFEAEEHKRIMNQSKAR